MWKLGAEDTQKLNFPLMLSINLKLLFKTDWSTYTLRKRQKGRERLYLDCKECVTAILPMTNCCLPQKNSWESSSWSRVRGQSPQSLALQATLPSLTLLYYYKCWSLKCLRGKGSPYNLTSISLKTRMICSRLKTLAQTRKNNLRVMWKEKQNKNKTILFLNTELRLCELCLLSTQAHRSQISYGFPWLPQIKSRDRVAMGKGLSCNF